MIRRILCASITASLTLLACSQTPHAATSTSTTDQVSTTMHAIGLYQYGGPEVLGLVEIPKPEPATGEVRVRVLAAGVNPVDEMVRSGLLAEYYKDHDFPFVPGMDIAGTVDAIGDSVDPSLKLRVGVDVTGMVSNFAGYGGYSEYICVPAGSLVQMPSGSSYAEAAAFMMPAMTARTAIDTLDLPKGSSVLVIGAAGAVGLYASVLADRDGLVVVGIASPSDEDTLKANGVTHFIPRADDANDRVRDIFPDGVDAVIDTAGIRTHAFPALKDNGQYIALRGWSDAPDTRGIKVTVINVRDRIDDHPALNEIARLVEQGILPIRIAAIFPTAESAKAHELQAARGVRGRAVIDTAEFTGKPAPKAND